MNAFTDLHAMLTAFFANLPWPVLLMDERGRITYANPALCEVDGAAVTPVGLELASCYPEYFAALRGEAPWRTSQSASVSRSSQGRSVTELIALHPLPFGACLFAIEQPDTTSSFGDAQLARLASLGFMVAGVCHEL